MLLLVCVRLFNKSTTSPYFSIVRKIQGFCYNPAWGNETLVILTICESTGSPFRSCVHTGTQSIIFDIGTKETCCLHMFSVSCVDRRRSCHIRSSWYDPCDGDMRRTNTYCGKFLRYNIKVKTEYTLFMYSKAVCKFSRGHATCVQFIFLIIGLA